MMTQCNVYRTVMIISMIMYIVYNIVCGNAIVMMTQCNVVYI